MSNTPSPTNLIASPHRTRNLHRPSAGPRHLSPLLVRKTTPQLPSIGAGPHQFGLRRRHPPIQTTRLATRRTRPTTIKTRPTMAMMLPNRGAGELF